VDDVIEEPRLHGKNNMTPFEGRRTRGGAVATVVRGNVVMRDGELIGPPRGRMVTRCPHPGPLPEGEGDFFLTVHLLSGP